MDALTPRLQRECEARYWNVVLCDRLADMVAEEGEAIEAGTVAEMVDEFKKRIIKKRGADSAALLFGEMVKQWEHSRVHTTFMVFGAEKSIKNTLRSDIT